MQKCLPMHLTHSLPIAPAHLRVQSSWLWTIVQWCCQIWPLVGSAQSEPSCWFLEFTRRASNCQWCTGSRALNLRCARQSSHLVLVDSRSARLFVNIWPYFDVLRCAARESLPCRQARSYFDRSFPCVIPPEIIGVTQMKGRINYVSKRRQIFMIISSWLVW